MNRYALFLIAAIALADTAPVADENMRMTALQAIFPGMQISVMQGKHIDDSWPEDPRPAELNSPDALAKENIYRVTGKPTNEAEKRASDQLITHQPSTTRLLRFQIFRWPTTSGLLAVLQYKFEDSLPSMECPSIGLLVQLASAGKNWRVRDRFLVEPMHHFTLQTIRMANLTGGDGEQLILESDFGGAEMWGTNMMIFNLGTKLEQAFEVTTQINDLTGDMFTQVLDLPRTIEQQGQKICFTKTTTFEDGTPLVPVRVTNPCYIPDEDINRREREEREGLLKP